MGKFDTLDSYEFLEKLEANEALVCREGSFGEALPKLNDFSEALGLFSP
jgi:hypothetical protein